MIVPRGEESILPGDRVIIIGSPVAAGAWSNVMAHGDGRIDDVVVFGAGATGVAIARVLARAGDPRPAGRVERQRARDVAEELSGVRVFHASGLDPDFLDRERIGNARAAIFAMGDDAKNLFAATLAKVHGAAPHDGDRLRPDLDRGVRAGRDRHRDQPAHGHGRGDGALRPRPRIQQLAMLEGDRFEVLDITVRPDSKLVNMPFKELPMTGSLIGAIVRDGRGDLPARRRHAPARRPGDHLHRVGPGDRGRAGTLTGLSGL